MTNTGDGLEPLDAEVVADPGGYHPPPAPSYAEVTGYTEAGTPTFDHVRDKIEQRAAIAIGSTELTAATPEAAAAEDAFAQRQAAARARLDEIRKSR